MMQKIKCTIAYDGSGFSGYQYQQKGRTVQGEIEKALQKIHKGKAVRIQSSGRTDTGVHALAQVFHFETTLKIQPYGWYRALKTLLPDDVELKNIVPVEHSFHARYDAVEKEYRYFVLNRKHPDIFRRHYVYHSSKVYDVKKMQEACKLFEGTHDFTSFSSAKSTVKGSKIRTLYTVQCERIGEEIQFIIRGNGFLRHMVRIIVGALLEVGHGDLELAELKRILQEKDRQKAGITIPSEGLYLWNVTY